jgi:hypothetical protein
MAAVDPSLAEPTPTGAWATRVDIYRSAVAELKAAGFGAEATPEDAQMLAQWFAGTDFS